MNALAYGQMSAEEFVGRMNCLPVMFLLEHYRFKPVPAFGVQVSSSVACFVNFLVFVREWVCGLCNASFFAFVCWKKSAAW